MVTKEEILMNRIKYEDLSPELKANLDDLVAKVNVIRKAYGKPLIVSSGYRSPAQNAAAGGAKRSNHMILRAVDFADSSREFTKWCLANIDLLNKVGLYMEDPNTAVSWVHLQSTPTKNNPFKV